MLFTKRVCNCMGADHGKHIDFRNLHGKGSLELTFVRDHVCKAVSEAATTCTKEVEISTAAFAIPSQHHARKHWFSMLGVVQVGHCLHESSKRTKPLQCLTPMSVRSSVLSRVVTSFVGTCFTAARRPRYCVVSAHSFPKLIFWRVLMVRSGSQSLRLQLTSPLCSLTNVQVCTILCVFLNRNSNSVFRKIRRVGIIPIRFLSLEPVFLEVYQSGNLEPLWKVEVSGPDAEEATVERSVHQADSTVSLQIHEICVVVLAVRKSPRTYKMQSSCLSTDRKFI